MKQLSESEKKKRYFKDIFDKYSLDIYRVAYYISRDKYIAEEAVQDTFINAYTKLDTLNDLSNLKPWLIKIATNCTKAKLKKGNNVLFISTLKEFDGTYCCQTSSDTLVQDEVEYNELKYYLKEQLDLLDPDFREVIILYYYEQLSYAEISKRLNLHIGTVKSRLNRAKIKLKKIMQNNIEH